MNYHRLIVLALILLGLQMSVAGADDGAVADFVGALDSVEAESGDSPVVESDDPEIPVTASALRASFRENCLSASSRFNVRSEVVPAPTGSLLRHTYECATQAYGPDFRINRYVLHLDPLDSRLKGLEVYRSHAMLEPAAVGIAMGVGVLASMKSSNLVYGARDKMLHAVAGSLISSSTALVSYYGLRLNAWQSVGIGLGASMAVALAKEYIYDRRVPGHNVEFHDFLATAMGGAISSITISIPLSTLTPFSGRSSRRSHGAYRAPRFVSPR